MNAPRKYRVVARLRQLEAAVTAALLKAAGLWAKTSAKGRQHFVGRWGGVKILVMANNDRQGDSDPSHFLFISEAPERPRPVEKPPEQKRQAAPRRRSRARRELVTAAERPLLDDRVDDLWHDDGGER